MPQMDWEGGEKQEAAREATRCNEPGIYYIEVVDCKEKTSKKGDQMFECALTALDFHARLCWDTIMLAGGGLGMGMAKLSGLGFSKEDDENVEAHQLVGRRAYVFVDWDEYNGEKRLKVTSKRGSRAGYWKEDDKPDKVRVPPTPGNLGGETGNDNPFAGDALDKRAEANEAEFIEADDTPF